MARFEKTYCSQCGGEFGPGDSGYSHCRDHGPKIVTHHEFPPIPVRSFDWTAHYDGFEEAGPYGYGKTEAEAVADLVENCDPPE